MKSLGKWIVGCLAAVVLGGVAMIVIFVLVGRAADRHPSPSSLVPTDDVSVDEMVADYKANEVTADGRYKSYPVRVTGTVKSVSKGLLGGQFVVLRGTARAEWRNVQCDVSEEDAASLRVGDVASVEGVGGGMMGNILVRKGRVVRKGGN
jgi:hypothetical protein